MKAIVYTEYGNPDVLKLMEVVKPKPKDNEVLVKIEAVSLNSSDYEFLTAHPIYARMWGLFKPKNTILGSDIAGYVEAIGKNVSGFQPNDEVFGDIFTVWGGLAEYVCVPEKLLIKKPDSMTFEEIASIPQAGVVALQGLRDKGQIQPEQKILINGAGGGSGTFAIQLAKKIYNAEVTGVDNTGKLDVMRSIGADHVVDYTKEDFTKNGQRYDLILDFVAHHSFFDYKRALSSKGRYVMVGGSMSTLFQIAFMGSIVSMFGGKKMGILGHKQNKEDLEFMISLYQSGMVKPVIDKIYTLSETAEAFRYLGEGHAKGKVVISVGQ